MKELEIEFKNLLTEEDYKKIYDFYNLEQEETINNSNFYYETEDFDLKQAGVALRIRHTDTKSEMTLKIKGARANEEYNIPYERNQNPEKIEVTSLPQRIKEQFIRLGIEKDVLLSQKIVTERKEKILDEGLLVLDKTYFLGNIVDYELEFEVRDYEKGKVAFESILDELKIEKKEAKPKIARAYGYKK